MPLRPLCLDRIFSPLFIVQLLILLSCKDSYASTDSTQTSIKEKVRMSFIDLLKSPHALNFSAFSQFFPLRDNPTVGYRTSLRKDEKILFDVHPVLTLGIFNDFKTKLSEGKLFSQGYALFFRPQFRMYNEQSKPVKMPSYNITMGLQHLYRINRKNFIGYSIESGHYSNGQSGSAMAGGGRDGSAESDSLWALITPDSKLSDVINRKDGDFATNLSEIIANYRYIPKFDQNGRPRQTHSFSLGMVFYHQRLFGVFNIGGNGDGPLRIYGKYRFLAAYEYSYLFPSGYRINITETFEGLAKAHPSVNPIRSVSQLAFYLPQSLGIYINYTYGHDDYNLRLVDSGHQFGIGITWDVFPPVKICE